MNIVSGPPRPVCCADRTHETTEHKIHAEPRKGVGPQNAILPLECWQEYANVRDPFSSSARAALGRFSLSLDLLTGGAVRSVIPAHVREQLGVALVGQRVAEYADGRNDVAGFTEPIRFELLQRDTFDDALVIGSEVLIGQTVLEKTDLQVDCRRGRVVPNPAHPDQPVNKVK